MRGDLFDGKGECDIYTQGLSQVPALPKAESMSPGAVCPSTRGCIWPAWFAWVASGWLYSILSVPFGKPETLSPLVDALDVSSHCRRPITLLAFVMTPLDLFLIPISLLFGTASRRSGDPCGKALARADVRRLRAFLLLLELAAPFPPSPLIAAAQAGPDRHTQGYCPMPLTDSVFSL